MIVNERDRGEGSVIKTDRKTFYQRSNLIYVNELARSKMSENVSRLF
jgi:hypothetical protein